MDNLTEIEMEAAADTAEAEKDNIAAAELGKFKDVKALMQAYSNLEAEFTRRSQRLKELENANKPDSAPAKAATAEQDSRGQEVYDGDDFIRAAVADQRVRDAVICGYLKAVTENKGVAFLAGGTGVSAARNSPKSIKEAGELAKNILNKGEKF